MKFPSLKYLINQTGESFLRFYLPVIFAAVGSFAGIMLIDAHQESPVITKIVFTCVLSISASMGCSLFAERSRRRELKLAMPLAAVLFSVAYGLFLAPDSLTGNYRSLVIFAVLGVVMHYWVAIAAYLPEKDASGFWRFNELLYSRMIIAGLFSLALYAGLSLAIAACDILLKIKFEATIYAKLFIFIIGIFNTWFFVAGVPSNFEELSTETTFPKSLKIFTQYILMPIVTLYMAILYAYSFKIINIMSLPRGYVSLLIMWYAVLGILAVLLVSPLRNSEENGWVRLFSRFFFVATLPLVVLLFLAVYARVSQYGITESRYYLAIMAGWLCFVSLYFIFSSRKRISIVPQSLVVIGILSLLGPWSVFSVSERSQLHRLENILQKNKIWEPGKKVVASDVTLQDADEARASAIIDYFAARNAIPALQEIFALDLKGFATVADRNTVNSFYAGYSRHAAQTTQLMEILSAHKLPPPPVKLTNKNFEQERGGNPPDLRFSSESRKGVNVAGFRRICRYQHSPYREKTYIYPSASDSLAVNIMEQDSLVYLTLSRNDKVLDKVDLNGLVKRLRAKTVDYSNMQFNQLPTEELTVDHAGPIKLRIIVLSIIVKDEHTSSNSPIINGFDSWILLR